MCQGGIFMGTTNHVFTQEAIDADAAMHEMKIERKLDKALKK